MEARTGTYVYSLTKKGLKELAERGGQAGAIYTALKSKPSTAADLVKKLVRRFDSVGIAKLNISWYLTKWKSASFVSAKKSK